MTIISDTIYYRDNGTVSSVSRTERHSFIKPSGAEDIENQTTVISLDELKGQLGDGVALVEQRNQALEAQIVSERERAQAAIGQITAQRNTARDAAAQLTDELAAVRSELAEAKAEIERLKQPQAADA